MTQTRELFSKAFADGRRKKWRFNHSPLYLDFLEGKADFQCTPWGVPLYTLQGWQRPCYLMDDGYVDTWKELIEDDRLGQVRPRQGPALRQLHGALRLRADRGPRDHGLPAARACAPWSATDDGALQAGRYVSRPAGSSAWTPQVMLTTWVTRRSTQVDARARASAREVP